MSAKSTIVLGLAIIAAYALGLAVSELIDHGVDIWDVELLTFGATSLLVVARLHFPQWKRVRKPRYACAGGQPIRADEPCPKCGASINQVCGAAPQITDPAQ